jgi:type VI secretion system protein ImpA
MPFRDDLLEPIEGPNPAGEYLRYDPVYDQIKEARKYDDPDEPRGAFERDLKKADYGKAAKLAGDALAKRSKDLQLVAWLTEATIRREGLSGLLEGLALLKALLERFWDHLYPEIDEGDLEMRAGPLGWVGGHSEMLLAVRSAPLNQSGHGLIDYEEARRLGSEGDADTDQRQKARAEAAESGKVLLEDWEEAFTATSKDWFKALVASVHGSIETLESLEDYCDEAFADATPSFLPLKDVLKEIRRVTDKLLAKKLELEPDPPEAEPVLEVDAGATAAEGEGDTMSADSPTATGPVSVSVEPQSREDAAARVSAAARFLRVDDPANPAPYLMVRGLRWGELRAGGSHVDPRTLAAPPTQVRTRLKSLLLDGKWMDLLHAGEDVMATEFGRGWLDLQRYVLTACDGLGPDFEVVAAAIKGSLRGLLADLPTLPELTLMDDSPTANRETRLWLQEDVGFAAFSDEAEAELEGKKIAAKPIRDAWQRAQEKARAGQPRKAIELLMDAASRENSERTRFIRRGQAAGIMVDASMEAVAMPILREMLAQIDEHKLEDWEEGEVLSGPMGLLYHCMGRLEGDSDARRNLYLRVCKVDPMQAIRFNAGSGQGASAEVAAAGQETEQPEPHGDA